MSMGILVFLLALVLSAIASFEFPGEKRLAERKCDEYRKLTVKTSTLITLAIRPTVIKYDDYKCPNTLNLIVGGEEARRGEFPHQALLGYPLENDKQKIKFSCGGSLISERYVLTAAHCGNHAKPTVVRLAELDLIVDDEEQVDFDVEQFIKHPEYSARRAYHDIALVQLEQEVYFTKMLRPACLWTDRNLNMDTALATGFGKTDFTGNTSETLKKVQLDIFDSSECSFYASNRKLPQGIIDSQICVGSLRGSRDTCQGDSGGPLEIVTDQKGCTFHLIGVTSLGAACGLGSPSIYTKVASYVDWIENVVWAAAG